MVKVILEKEDIIYLKGKGLNNSQIKLLNIGLNYSIDFYGRIDDAIEDIKLTEND